MFIKMQYPNIEGNRLCDGKIHDIRPDKLARFNYNGEELYLLSYYDYTMNSSCHTILTRERNGKFYKNPLTDYSNLQSIISSVRLFKVPLFRLGRKIELGVTRDGSLSALNEPMVGGSSVVPPIPTISLVSSAGGVPPTPPASPAAAAGGVPPTPPASPAAAAGGVPPTPPPSPVAAAAGGVPPTPPNDNYIVIDKYKYPLTIYTKSGLKKDVFAVEFGFCDKFGEKFYNDLSVDVLSNPNFEVIQLEDRRIKVVYIPEAFIRDMEEDELSPIQPYYVNASDLTLTNSIDVYTNADNSLYAVPRCVYDAYFSDQMLSYFGRGKAKNGLVVFYIKKHDLDRVIEENKLFVTLHPLLSSSKLFDEPLNQSSLSDKDDLNLANNNNVVGSIEPQLSSVVPAKDINKPDVDVISSNPTPEPINNIVVPPVKPQSPKNNASSEPKKVVSSKIINDVSMYYIIFNNLDNVYNAMKKKSSKLVIDNKFLQLDGSMNLIDKCTVIEDIGDTYSSRIQYFAYMMYKALKSKKLKVYEQLKQEYIEFELEQRNGKKL